MPAASFGIAAIGTTRSSLPWWADITAKASAMLLRTFQTRSDVVVPIAAIPRMVAALGELSRKYDVPIPCYGHAGDGNLHTRIVKDPDWPLEKWQRVLPEVLHELYELTAALGGRISGEHGIGHKRKKYMPMFVSGDYLDVCRAVKRALDPNNILNPGKIFDL